MDRIKTRQWYSQEVHKSCKSVVAFIGTYLYKHTFSDTDRLGKKPKKYLGFHFFDYL